MENADRLEPHAGASSPRPSLPARRPRPVLSIVREIMAAHGGTLTIASTPRHGTTASLCFAEAF